MNYFSRIKYFFIGLFLFSSIIFLLHYYVVGQATYGDGIYYYSYTKSLYFDHNIDLRNELGHHYSPVSNNNFIEEPLETVREKTKTGIPPSKYPIGPSLAWIPAMLIADRFSNLISIFDNKFPSNGYSNIYQIFIGIFNLTLVIFGLFILYKLLNLFFKSLICLLVIICIFAASNLFYYGSIDVINSHPLSFFLSTLFIFIWYKTLKDRTSFKWFLLGLTLGGLALTRTQDLIFIIVLFSDDIYYLLIKKQKLHILFGNASALIGFVVSFSPQLVSWQIMYGNFMHMPYIAGGEGFNLLKPHFVELLLNQKTGLLIWTPIYIIMVAGFFFLYKKNKIIAFYSIIIFISQFYLISSWSGWSQGESFSIRMLISVLPFLSLGLGSFFETISQKFGKNYVIVLSFTLIIINFYSIANFMLFSKAPTYDRGINTREMMINRVRGNFNFIR